MVTMKRPNHDPAREQLSLFLDEHVLLNSAEQDLLQLRLEEARSAFEQFRDLYPRGENVEDRLKLTGLLDAGLADLPEGGAGVTVLCRLAANCDDFARQFSFRDDGLISGIKESLYAKAAAMAGTAQPAGPLLPDGTPAGFAYLMAGKWDPAIASLQAALPLSPQNAHIYGYLGDAYTLRGDTANARACYLEALLVDPEAVDWHNLRDTALKGLKRRLEEELGLDAVAAAHWLGSHAYVEGFFRPRPIGNLEVMKTMIEEYLAMEKRYEREATAALGAGLFLRAIILCENERFLMMVKGIDFADIRARMKAISEPVFAAYMKWLKDRSRPRSERRPH